MQPFEAVRGWLGGCVPIAPYRLDKFDSVPPRSLRETSELFAL
ncbi:MAG: hypothetical protein PHF14_12780 [Verrucomicrobiota bacterium]|nr:hypothetical protein [Verrucomicrobiota bacterium]MDD8047331.1 hypothetical protein [Verrucomicrobiota bacterium]